eukprot:jgi/Phyca11/21535/fgenesh1_pg.PHYCAscaffold_100_\
MSSAPPPRWTRPAQFLVYLVPVGGIPTDLFASYAQLLQVHGELPLRSLTRPGGYAAELSPFRSLDWAGTGALRFRFVSTAERVDSCDGEDVHASRRAIGVLGVCHSPTLTLSGGLRAAHAQLRRPFEDATASECEGLGDLVMFPVHHELEGTGESTVSLHLQVVMDTLAVNLLMSLESAIRSATSSAASSGLTLKAAAGDLASVLLDVNVEPQQANSGQQQQASPLVLSRDTKGDATFGSASSPTSRSSLTSIPSPLAAGVAALDPRNRRRKRQLARREKLLGDYNVLVSCISDAMDHYTVAVEMLREEERRSGGAPGDALWLAAALEGYVFCLYTETPSKFSAELVEKASEAVAFYSKAGTTELESLFIENLGWYYASVAITSLTRASVTGEARLLESVWAKKLLWELLERGLMLFPELQPQRQVEFLIQTSRMLEAVGHRRRVAVFLHEAASLLLARNAPSVDAQSKLLLSPSSVLLEMLVWCDSIAASTGVDSPSLSSTLTRVAVKLQEVRAWVSFTGEDNDGAKDDAVECYPCFFTLEPYQKHKTVVLGIQPLRVGTCQSVTLLPCSSELLPAVTEAATTDHLYCAIMVHIANPTETTFRFQLHRDMDDSGEAACEAEIGRQCSRRFVVEVPRLPLDQEPLNLVQALNEMLEMQWETYFGTRGRLLCEEQHVGSIDDQSWMKRELLLPPLSLELLSALADLTRVDDTSELNGDASKPKHGRDRSLSLHPLTFFQARHLRVEARVLEVELFQYVPISIKIQPTEGGEQSVSDVEVEVVITEEGEQESSEHVVVVGLLKTHIYGFGEKAQTMELRQELEVLVEILTEFQQQNDDIRVRKPKF